jgi:serine/threonine-protein kinase RsbW
VTRFTLTLSVELARAGEVAALVEGAVQAWGLAARRAHALHLCAEEVFASIALHGCGQVTLELTGDATKQRLVVTDTGSAFDPTTAPPLFRQHGLCSRGEPEPAGVALRPAG